MMKPANYAPIYACVYAQLAEIARSHGYAMAAHGSLAADFDLVCIPWVEGASDPQSVIDEITSSFCIEQAGKPEVKEHGRVAYTISFSFGECRLDLSFMPTVEQSVPERVSVPVLTDKEREDLLEFHEAVCCDAGHRVEKEGMQRLAEIGAVQYVGFGKHRMTEFGVALLASHAEGGKV